MKILANSPIVLLGYLIPGGVALFLLYDKWGDELQKALWVDQLSKIIIPLILVAAALILGIFIYALSSVVIEDLVGERVLRRIFKRHDEARNFKERQQAAEELRHRRKQIPPTQPRQRNQDGHPGLGAWCRDFIKETTPNLAKDIELQRATSKCWRSLALLFLLLLVMNLGATLGFLPLSKKLATDWLMMFVIPALLAVAFLYIFHKYNTKVMLRTYEAALQLDASTPGVGSPASAST